MQKKKTLIVIGGAFSHLFMLLHVVVVLLLCHTLLSATPQMSMPLLAMPHPLISPPP